MFRVFTKVILVLPLILLLGQFAQGGSIRKVVYHEGATEYDDSSSVLEDIPPRAEWFRVRGSSMSQHRPKALAHGSPDIVVLHSTRTDDVQGSEGMRGTRTRLPGSLSREGSTDDQLVQVHVRNRGRVGFQKFHDTNGEEQDDSTEQQITSTTRRQGGEALDLSKLPSVSSTTRTKPRNQNSRRENVQNRRGGLQGADTSSSDEDITGNPSSSEEDINQQQKPQEPDEDSRTDDYSPSTSRGSRISSENHQFFDDDEPVSTFSAKPSRVPSSNNIEILGDDLDSNTPPPHDQVAKMARYIVHNSNWTSVATISTMSPVKGYPFVNVFSVSDGPINNSSGIPYMYLTPLDMSVTDLKKDTRASLTMSLAQSDYCKQQQYDPEDPRCAHVILSGKIVKVTSSDEIPFARNAMYSKHPEMVDWPKDHGWFFAKLNMEHIIVLDYFGGAKTVSLDDYFRQTDL